MGFYKMLSEYYDDIFNVNNKEIDFVESYTPIGGSILDVACGTGEYCVLLKEKGYKVSGFDFSIDMIKKAKMKDSEIDFKVLNMLDIKEAYNKKFDSIFCFGNSIVHLKNISEVKRSLKGMYDMLKDGSYLMLQNINFDRIIMKEAKALPSIINENKDLIFKRIYERKEDKIVFNGNLYVNDKLYKSKTLLLALLKDEITAMLSDIGFSNIDAYGSFDKKDFSKENSYPLIIAARK